jgi:dTMP kinase
MVGGLFCVFEGIDGSGKSTLLRNVGELLRQKLAGSHPKRSILLLKEPTDGVIGRQIRELLSSGREIEHERWLDLFLLDRIENVNANILPALGRGDIILQDRYFYSNAAYQSRDALESERILEKNRRNGFPEPDLLFYLDLKPERAVERLNGRSERAAESFETLHQLQEIDARFRRILPPHTTYLDAERPPEWLAERVASMIVAKLG